ncbi:MAG: dUTP diphosphatase [Oleiphilaceae bacterium]|nr:dUTP diphosphatase [Oleiphilaceae bacterium]
MRRIIEAKVVNDLLGSDVPEPAYTTPWSAAMDLRACIAGPVTLQPGQRTLIPTGIAINMKDPNLVAVVASRSGLSLKHGVRVAQGIGVIDADYHGEIGVILINEGEHSFKIDQGDRIAQLMFQPVVQVDFDFVADFSTTTERGAGGFGHSGKV